MGSDDGSEKREGGGQPAFRDGPQRWLTSVRRRSWSLPVAPDVVVPWVAAAVIFAVFLVLALLRYHTFDAGYDVGYFRQAAHLISEGESPYITIRGLHFLADHAYFIFFPIAWSTAVLPAVPTLLAVQAAALGLGAIPLWRISRRLGGLPVGISALVLVAYGLYPALHNVNLADFHPEAIAIPALLAMALFGLQGRWVPYGFSMALVLASREDLAIVVVAFGVLLFLEGRRRAAVGTVVVAAAWFTFTTQVVLPSFADGELVQGSRWPQFGDSLGSVLVGMATSPELVLQTLVTEDNVGVVVALLAPVLLLPLLSLRHLLPGLPLQGLYLMSNVGAAHTIDFQYTVGIIPFVFLATVMALRHRRLRSGDSPDTTVPKLLVLASLLFSLQLSNALPLAAPWRWPSRDAADHARLEAIKMLGDDASVSATTRFWPYVADRTELFAYPFPLLQGTRYVADPVPIEQRRQGVDYVVVDTRELGVIYGQLDHDVLAELPELGFEEVFDREGILVFARTAPGRPESVGSGP